MVSNVVPMAVAEAAAVVAVKAFAATINASVSLIVVENSAAVTVAAVVVVDVVNFSNAKTTNAFAPDPIMAGLEGVADLPVVDCWGSMDSQTTVKVAVEAVDARALVGLRGPTGPTTAIGAAPDRQDAIRLSERHRMSRLHLRPAPLGRRR